MVGEGVLLSTQKLVVEKLELAEELAKHQLTLSKQRDRLKKTQAQVQHTDDKLQTWSEGREVLQDQRQIFAHDVELGSLFSLLKVGLTLLVTYVLKEFLGNARMDVSTFLDRMATLPATIRTTPQLEIVSFEYNERDPDMLALLRTHCDAINDRALRLRSGRTLRILVQDPPARKRPPQPQGSRVGSGDRFRR